MLRKGKVAHLDRIAVVAALLLIWDEARAGGTFAGATEITQLLNNGQLIDIALSAGQQLSLLDQQLVQLRNGTAIYGSMQVEDMLLQVRKIADVVRNSQGVAFNAASASQQFQALYPGAKRGVSATEYVTWSRNTIATIRNALEASGVAVDDMTSVDTVMSRVRSLAQTPRGQAQISQLALQVSNEQLAANTKLNYMIGAQTQAQSAYFASQIQSKLDAQSSMESFLGDPATAKLRGPKVDYNSGIQAGSAAIADQVRR